MPGRRSILSGAGDAAARAVLVEERWRRARHDKRDLEGEWWTNLAYYRGYQHVSWLASKGRLELDDVPSWKSQSTSNFILSDLTVLLGLIARPEPGHMASPSHISARAERAARAATLWLRHVWRDLRLADDVRMARLWTFLGGRALLQITWDEDAGDLAEVPDLDAVDPGAEPDLAAIPTRTERQGGFRCKVISPLGYYGDPLLPSLRQWPWIITSSLAHRDELAHTYGREAADAVPSEDPGSRVQGLEKRLLHSMGGSQMGDWQDVVPVREFHERPTDKFPEGRRIVQSGGVPLDEGDNPYGDMLPFVEFGSLPSPGSYWHEALVTHVRPLQDDYNNARARHFDAGNLMGASKWLAAQGTILDGAVDNEPGEVIEVAVDAPYMPVRVDPPTVGRHWLEIAEVAVSDMDRVTGISDAARGRGEGFASGRALAIAQEGTVTRQNILVQDHQRALEDLGTLILRISERFLTGERMVRVLGRDNEPLVAAFSAEDARLVDRVTVEETGGFPFSRIARMEAVLEAWEQNLIVNRDGQRDPQKALRLLEFGDTDRMVAGPDLLDRRHSENENEMFLSGRADEVDVAAWDDHQVHADTIRDLLVSEEGRQLAKDDPEAHAAAVAHRDMHIQMIAMSEAGPPGAGTALPARPAVGGGAGGETTGAPRQTVMQPGQAMAEGPQPGGPPLVPEIG